MEGRSMHRAQLEEKWKRNIGSRNELLPPSLKAAISRVVLSQFFKTLTKFIEKNTKIYSTKLIPLDLL